MFAIAFDMTKISNNIWRLNENVVTLHPNWNNYTISII